jgi:hypothetical protein
MEHATMLMRSHRSVLDVAIEWGFQTQQHLFARSSVCRRPRPGAAAEPVGSGEKRRTAPIAFTRIPDFRKDRAAGFKDKIRNLTTPA